MAGLGVGVLDATGRGRRVGVLTAPGGPGGGGCLNPCMAGLYGAPADAGLCAEGLCWWQLLCLFRVVLLALLLC